MIYWISILIVLLAMLFVVGLCKLAAYGIMIVDNKGVKDLAGVCPNCQSAEKVEMHYKGGVLTRYCGTCEGELNA